MEIPFLDLSVKDPVLKGELMAAVDKVLTHGRIVLGPEVAEFEEQLAEICHQQFVVGVNSGTDALFMALRSLDVGPGDEVITTPMSWIATLNAITMCGATPVFVDIAPDLNIDPSLIEQAITPKTKAMVPVHYTGRLCDMEPIMDVADRHGLTVVEDAAQSFTGHNGGGVAGSFGRVNSFSMNPMKVFSAYGEAGAVATSDEALHEKLVSLRYAGTVNREDCHYPSLNGRLDTIQAAMLLVNLKYLDDKIARRRSIAAFYSEALGESVICPQEDPGEYHVYYTYTIIAERRDELREHLAENGIETKIHHPILMPYHTAYQHMLKPEIPVAEHMVERILSIPAHENIQMEEAEYVADKIKEFFAG